MSGKQVGNRQMIAAYGMTGGIMSIFVGIVAFDYSTPLGIWVLLMAAQLLAVSYACRWTP